MLLDPLFYAQSMMAQLDMPAMLFTVLGLLLFLTDRHAAAAAACTALVLAKETGVLLPLIFIVVLYRDPARSKYAAYYLAPFAALAVWFAALWHSTGYLFGDPGFTHYNTTYSLNPVRASLALLRRFYYLFIDDFRWVGALAILFAWKRSSIYSTRAWKITWCFVAAHILLVSLLGGATLERYLLPVLPLVYIAMGAAFQLVRPRWRYAGVAALAAGLVAGLFLNPPFPFPYENNLALADFVHLHRTAAQYLEKSYPGETVYTAWPLTQALRNPAFGYVNHTMSAAETSDLRVSTLDALKPEAPAKSIDVLVLYSRTWEPSWGVLTMAGSSRVPEPILRIRARNDARRSSPTFWPGPGPALDPGRPMDRDIRSSLTLAEVMLSRSDAYAEVQRAARRPVAWARSTSAINNPSLPYGW